MILFLFTLETSTVVLLTNVTERVISVLHRELASNLFKQHEWWWLLPLSIPTKYIIGVYSVYQCVCQ